MGNEGSNPETNIRYRTIENKKRRDSSQYPNIYKKGRESRVNSSFAVNNSKNVKSFQIQDGFDYSEQSKESHVALEPITKKQNNNRFQSLDFDDYQSRKQTPVKDKKNDKVLEQLSRKNQLLRQQLKTISDKLSIQINKKKFVPKKKVKSQFQEEDQVAIQKQNMGLKRQLENGYKQIQMYKKTIQNLKGREQGDTSDYRLKLLEGNIGDKDKQINQYIKRIEALQKIKRKQDGQIDKDINDDLKDGLQGYKKEAQNFKKALKQLAARDRQREPNYKKQQAYLCDLERKNRQLLGQFFPELKGGTTNPNRKQYQKTAASDKDQIIPKQFRQVEEEAKLLRLKHEDYYRRIDTLLKAKNRRIEDQNWMKQQIIYKERIIEALKIKIQAFKNMTKPRKNSLFGYQYGSSGGVQSQYQETTSEVEKQLMQQLNQDQFDIKHLLSNIPKPRRKKPEQVSNGYSSDDDPKNRVQKGAGMFITNQKASPKKWGAVNTRTQERGKHFKEQLLFQDRGQIQGETNPQIVGVNVWVDKNNTVLALQMIYLNKGEIRYGAKSAESVDGIIRRFDLQNPDYLKNVSFTVTSQGFVESLTFYSKQGKVGKFGNKRSVDENVNFGLSSNERPYLFFGSSSKFEGQPRINILGIQICQE